MMQFELFGHDRVEVDTAVVYVDHNILQIDFKNPDDHRFLQAMAAKYGAWFSRPGNGICHYVHCERFAVPGKTLVGADSHTTQSGSAGMIAIGAGGLDVAVCMAGHPFELPCPKIVGVFLENELQRPWIQAKDVILELLRRRGVRGGRGAIFEFTGPGRDDAELHGARDDREHDRRARRDRRRLSGRRRDEGLVRRAGARGGLRRARDRRLGGRLRRGRAHRPRGARPARREAVQPRQRRPGRGARRDASSRRSASAPRSTRPTRTWRSCGATLRGQPDLREARVGDRDSRLAADPRPDHAVGHLRRPALGGRAHARARVRALRRDGPGAALGRELAAHLQPELPGAERDGRRQRLPLLARGRSRLDAEGRDRRPARVRPAGAAAAACRRDPPSSRRTSSRRRPRTRPPRSRSRAGRTSSRRPSRRSFRTCSSCGS